MSPDDRPRRRVTLQLPRLLQVSLQLGLAAIIVAALHYGQDLLVPLALAGLLAFLLDPLVTRLRRWRVPRALAVAVVSLATLAVLAAASLLLASQMMQLGRDLPRYQSTIETKLRTLRKQLTVDRSFSSASRLLDVVEHEVDATRKALEAANGNGTPRAQAPMRVQVAAAEASPMKAVAAWVVPVMEPLLTAGVAIVLLIFILLERNELRDRLLRLAGGDLHPMTDALDEAARRVSRYLAMQVLVNGGYGLALGAALWLIGVPGAWLWGALAAVLRFVPYVGPVVGSVFPLAMAFAVDPGWQMLLWTLVLILVLELVVNNLVEPWLYGSSTGLASVAVLLSAAFWALLWGPVGLVLATPLTVCLVVMGRHVPHLRFLDLLLGSDPVFDAPTRLYQRLLAGDLEEAGDLAETEIAEKGLTAFYSTAALPALGRVAADSAHVTSAEHRHRVGLGMARLVQELRLEHRSEPEATAGATPAPVLCIALRWQADALAADMLAHALAQGGTPAVPLPATAISAERIAELELGNAEVVCLSSFHPQPEALVRHVCRRLLRLRPQLRIVLGLWHAPAALRLPDAAQALGAAALATSLDEAVQRVQALLPASALAADPSGGSAEAGADAGTAEAAAERAAALALCRRLEALRGSAGLQAAQRAAEVFGTAHAAVWWADERLQRWQADPAAPAAAGLEDFAAALLRPLLGAAGPAAAVHAGATGAGGAPASAFPPVLVVPDLAREPRLGDGGAVRGQRFAAAVPLRWDGGQTLGALFILDDEQRPFGEREQRLLHALAQELMARLQRELPAEAAAATGDAPAPAEAAAAAVRCALPPPLGAAAA